MTSNSPKQLWLLVGGNGAGKTTFYETRLAHTGLPFVNADNIARAESVDSYTAARTAEQQRARYLKAGNSFCFETVFSHPSKIDFLGEALALGYRIHLIAIHLDDPELNAARVSQRIDEGGHTVPLDKIAARIPRAMDNIGKAIPLCHEVLVLDNSSDIDPYRPVLTIVDGNIREYSAPLPNWAERLIPRGSAPTKMTKPVPVVIQPVTAGGMPAFKVAGDAASITPETVREANEDH